MSENKNILQSRLRHCKSIKVRVKINVSLTVNKRMVCLIMFILAITKYLMSIYLIVNPKLHCIMRLNVQIFI